MHLMCLKESESDFLSISTAMTSLAFSARYCVIVPIPGPISKHKSSFVHFWLQEMIFSRTRSSIRNSVQTFSENQIIFLNYFYCIFGISKFTLYTSFIRYNCLAFSSVTAISSPCFDPFDLTERFMLQ